MLFFRDQHLTPDQHKAFARRFGDIDINRFFNAVDGHPEIAEVLKEADQTANIGGGWHTDHSYDPAPARGSILYAHEIPPIGGDTCFIGMGAAYGALSPPLQDMLGSLTATHSGAHVFGRQSPTENARPTASATPMPFVTTSATPSSSPTPTQAGRCST